MRGLPRRRRAAERRLRRTRAPPLRRVRRAPHQFAPVTGAARPARQPRRRGLGHAAVGALLRLLRRRQAPPRALLHQSRRSTTQEARARPRFRESREGQGRGSQKGDDAEPQRFIKARPARLPLPAAALRRLLRPHGLRRPEGAPPPVIIDGAPRGLRADLPREGAGRARREPPRGALRALLLAPAQGGAALLEASLKY